MSDSALAPSGQPTSTAPLAEATNISKRYGSTIALRDSGIVITEGETHALVGRNGAG